MAGAIPFSEYVRRFSQLTPVLRTTLDKEMDAAAPVLKGIIQSVTRTAPPASPRGGRGAVATGAYLADWRAFRTSQGGHRGILIANTKEYAPVVDYGRKRGAKLPPVDAIKKWAMVRLGLSESEAKRAAWPIAQAIKARGLKKRGVLHSDQRNRQLARFMEKRFSKVVAGTFRKVMGT